MLPVGVTHAVNGKHFEMHDVDRSDWLSKHDESARPFTQFQVVVGQIFME